MMKYLFIRKVALYILIAIIAFLLGMKLKPPTSPSPVNILQPTRMGEKGGSFTNPLLDCSSGLEFLNVSAKDMKTSIETYVNEENNKDSNLLVAVYFRDLNNGPWFGINQDIPFSPLSLLKLPLMMTYYKQAQSTPDILAANYIYPGFDDPTMSQTDGPVMKPGSSHTVDDLINRMMKYSDNAAYNILYPVTDLNSLNQIYKDLDVKRENDSDGEVGISVRDYASFFRILYNASYLDREYSEKALSLMSESVFKDGIVAGVSKKIPIAHKYGIRWITESNQNQLHDCGIIYYPNRPYILCVMTRGGLQTKLEDVIGHISKIVYSHIDAK